MDFLKLFILTPCILTVFSCGDVNKKIHSLDILLFSNKNQILLTNEADFKEHSSLHGASSFLIEYKNSIYAVTAKHLIGKDGGVEPEILPMDLPVFIKNWKMYPRIENLISNDTVTIDNSNYKYIQTKADILLLKINDYKGNLCKLKPVTELPIENDKLFIIGCPYSEVNCRQNVYTCIYSFFDTEINMIVCELKEKIEFSGFSGAPIIDKNGFVVAVLAAGWEEKGRYFVGGTFIKEIEKFKY